MSNKTRSALRATLRQEDAALEERLPESPQPGRKTPTAETADAVSPAAPVTPAVPEITAQPAVAPVSAAPAPAQATAAIKPEKRAQERFKLAASDRRRLVTLRDALKAAGRRPSKSELVRAGLAVLAAQGTAEVMALVAGGPGQGREDTPREGQEGRRQAQGQVRRQEALIRARAGPAPSPALAPPFEETTMTQKNPMQISGRMDEIDAALETEGMPSYSQMWATNAELREELERLRERLAMANTTLSTLHGDLLQTELIVATASSVDQIRRQLVRLESDRGAQAARAQERFARRWGMRDD